MSKKTLPLSSEMNMYKLFFCLFALLVVSCDKEEDFHVDVDDTALLTHSDSVAAMASYERIHTHTAQGTAYPVVIMADGYDVTEVNNGTYGRAIDKAEDALFDREPMSSLKPYIDVYAVTAISGSSGVGTKKKDTAFSTYFPDIEHTTEVGGDSLSVMACAEKVLQNYGYSKQGAREAVLNHCLMIVLLNSSRYAGVTYFCTIRTSSDGYPVGNAISYIPVNPVIEVGGTYGFRGDVFNELIQHEAVGHGIGKLGDEYWYDDTTKYPEYQTPTDNAVKLFNNLFTNGYMQNIHYDDEISIVHDVESSSWVYPFAIDSRYASEQIRWYPGAYVYVKKFFRSSVFSVMNSTVDIRNNAFNTPSRAAIYRNVRHVADSSWQWDYEEFVAFDKENRSTSAAKGIVMDTDVPVVMYSKRHISPFSMLSR